MPKAYSYLRFSTPDQQRGDSFRRQTERSQAYAKEQGLDLDTSLTFQDLGVSALKGEHRERGALGAMLRAIETGKIPQGSSILVEDLDRLSREKPTKAFSAFSDLLRAGVKVVTLTDSQCYSEESLDEDPTQLMMSIMAMYRAHQESALKGKRVKAAMESKRTKARSSGAVFTKHLPYWLTFDPETNEIIEVPNKADTVRLIFDLACSGVSIYAISKMLNEDKVPTIGRSKVWSTAYVRRLLVNPSVYGEFQPMEFIDKDGSRVRVPSGDPIPDYYPQVITRGQFEEANNVRETRGSYKLRTKNLRNLFTGLVHCGHCRPEGWEEDTDEEGIPMGTDPRQHASMFLVNKSRGAVYLVCSTAQRGLGCKYHGFRYDLVERSILETLREVDLRELIDPTDEESERAKYLEESLSELQGARVDLESKRDRLVAAIEDDQGEVSSIVEALRKREADLKVNEEQTKVTKVELNAIKHRWRFSEERISTLQETLVNWSQSNDIPERELHARRVKLAHHLREVIESITFERSSDPRLHGEIEIMLKGVPRSRHIHVIKRQKEAHVLEHDWFDGDPEVSKVIKLDS